MRLVLQNIIFVLVFSKIHAQVSVTSLNEVSSKFFDHELKVIKPDDRNLDSRSVFLITNVGCQSCIEYIETVPKACFIFILNNESLIEINRALARNNVKKGRCYFTTWKYLSAFKSQIEKGPSPILLGKKQSGFELYVYSRVDSLTKGFTDKSYSFMKQFIK